MADPFVIIFTGNCVLGALALLHYFVLACSRAVVFRQVSFGLAVCGYMRQKAEPHDKTKIDKRTFTLPLETPSPKSPKQGGIMVFWEVVPW